MARIIIAGGGTAGHIEPGLAVAFSKLNGLYILVSLKALVFCNSNCLPRYNIPFPVTEYWPILCKSLTVEPIGSA